MNSHGPHIYMTIHYLEKSISAIYNVITEWSVVMMKIVSTSKQVSSMMICKGRVSVTNKAVETEKQKKARDQSPTSAYEIAM